MIRDIDAALELGPFLAGNRYSLADAAVTPYVHRLWLLGCDELWSKDRPGVKEWYARIKARPSFSEVFTKHENETRHRYDRDRSKVLGTWKRFRAALQSIGPEVDDPAVRMPPRIWSPSSF